MPARLLRQVLPRALAFALLLAGASAAHAQPPTPAPAVRFETNRTLAVLHFLHTANAGQHHSPTYRALIDSALRDEVAFTLLLAEYAVLDFESGYRRPNLPRRRYRSRTVMDFLWLHAAASHSLDDFAERTFGLLPVGDHSTLMRVLAQAEPYYRRLVWDPERAAIARTEHFLDQYEDRVGLLFGRIAGFYGTPWPASAPFTVALCPIPAATGTTSAVPKVNTLVCSYLSRKEDEWRALLGVAVHEMCHSIYDEQPAGLQQQIDDWFSLSRSRYATHAYTYFNEGLATAIGNGWAYAQINGEPDPNPWYADATIDGYARALLPLVTAYLREGQPLDRPFVQAAIEAFAKTFPDADRDLSVLVNAVGIYVDTDDEATVGALAQQLTDRFRVNSSYVRGPLGSGGAIRSLGYPQLTKVIVLDRDHARRWRELGRHFGELAGRELPTGDNASYAFFDEPSRSAVLVLLVEDAEGLGALLDQLRRDRLLTFGESVAVSRAASY